MRIEVQKTIGEDERVITPDEYIEILESNGIQLFEYQKVLLKIMTGWSDNIIPCRHCGYNTAKELVNIYKNFEGN